MPFDAVTIARLLRNMSDEALASVTFTKFQMHPAPVVMPGAVIRELIANEKARRFA